MDTNKRNAAELYNSLKNDETNRAFPSKGHLGEAGKAIEPILQAFEAEALDNLSVRMGKAFRTRLELELSQLKKAGLKRVIRIANPRLCSRQANGNAGFARQVDIGREWRECELRAAVLEQYIDDRTGVCVSELFDDNALITLTQSRHIRAAQQQKQNADAYTREQYHCPSCGALLLHIADQTDCPYCGGHISFRFFDWQVDSLYFDLHKESLLKVSKNLVEKTAVQGLSAGAKAAELLADAWDKQDKQSRSKAGYNNYLGGILTVILFTALTAIAVFFALPLPVRIAIGTSAVLLIITGLYKLLKATDQNRKKKRIIRFSDGYLRSCVYDEVWKRLDTKGLINFTIDNIRIDAVKNTEKSTELDIKADVITKHISAENQIAVRADRAVMKLTRARYPERIKSKGKLLIEKDCPSCGANFEPDEHNCCSYCGYNLRIESYVWQCTRYTTSAGQS